MLPSCEVALLAPARQKVTSWDSTKSSHETACEGHSEQL